MAKKIKFGDIFVIVIAIAAALIVMQPYLSSMYTGYTTTASSIESFYNGFTVQGHINVSGYNTTPKVAIFSVSQGTNYTSTIHNGYYSIILPSTGVYSVTIQWSGPFGSNGTCHPYSLKIEQYNSNENFSC